MPTLIRRITTAQFALLALPSQLTRKIDRSIASHLAAAPAVFPRGSDDRSHAPGPHGQNGWSDIAQHLTIDPGRLWTGRNWNLPPASARGHNGTAPRPVHVRDGRRFRRRPGPFDGDQRRAAIDVVAHLMRVFDLKDVDLKFHNEMTGQKTCPGTGITHPQVLQDVKKALKRPQPRATQGAKPFRLEHLLGSDAIRSGAIPDNVSAASVPENEAAAAAIENVTREAVRAFAAPRTRLESSIARGHDLPCWACHHGLVGAQAARNQSRQR